MQDPFLRAQRPRAVFLHEIRQCDEQLDRENREQRYREQPVQLDPGKGQEHRPVDQAARGMQLQLAPRRRSRRQLGATFVVPDVVDAAQDSLSRQQPERDRHDCTPIELTMCEKG